MKTNQTDKATELFNLVRCGYAGINPDFDKILYAAVNEHAALKSFVESIAKMDADYADKAVLESMVATAKQLTQAT